MKPPWWNLAGLAACSLGAAVTDGWLHVVYLSFVAANVLCVALWLVLRAALTPPP